MNRRNALWLALLVAAAGAVAFVLARRAGQAQPAVAPPVAPWAPDPGPLSVAAPPATPPAAAAPPAPVAPAAAPAPEVVEQPLPMWVRVTIVAAALVAFFAVSLIATRNV